MKLSLETSVGLLSNGKISSSSNKFREFLDYLMACCLPSKTPLYRISSYLKFKWHSIHTRTPTLTTAVNHSIRIRAHLQNRGMQNCLYVYGYKHKDIKILILWDDLLSLGKHSRCFERLWCLDLQCQVAQEDEGTAVPWSNGKYICTQRHVAPSQKT